MSRVSGASPFSAGAVIARKYRLVRLLGEGGDAARPGGEAADSAAWAPRDKGPVWQAVSEITGGVVALKLIVRPDPEQRLRLLQEAPLCGAIRHRNVVRIFDVGETGSGDPFVVMELLSGITLADRLARGGRLEPQEAARVGRDVARALAAAHENGIFHRDLQPSKVFLHEEPGAEAPVVKVLGFGEGRTPGRSGARSLAGHTAAVSPYMSPEQAIAISGAPALGETGIDERSDIWSLGAVMFELLSGAPPFEGDAAQVLDQVASGRAPMLWQKVRNLHPGLSGLVMSCLRRDREERPFPISEVAVRLDHFASMRASTPSLPVPRRPGHSSPPPRLPPPPRVTSPGSAIPVFTTGMRCPVVPPPAPPTEILPSPIPRSTLDPDAATRPTLPSPEVTPNGTVKLPVAPREASSKPAVDALANTMLVTSPLVPGGAPALGGEDESPGLPATLRSRRLVVAIAGAAVTGTALIVALFYALLTGSQERTSLDAAPHLAAPPGDAAAAGATPDGGEREISPLSGGARRRLSP